METNLLQGGISGEKKKKKKAVHNLNLVQRFISNHQ